MDARKMRKLAYRLGKQNLTYYKNFVYVVKGFDFLDF